MARPRSFLVTSPGYTATKWLAWALDAHPRIYCNHAAGSDVLERAFDDDELRAQVEEKLGPRDHLPLEAFFAELTARGRGALAVGNVHRYCLSALERNLERWPGSRPFARANLVRHPVSWVASGTGQLARAALAPVLRARLRRHHRRHHDAYVELGVPLLPSLEVLSFLYLCHRLAGIAREIRSASAPHVPMEALTSDPDRFAEVFEGLAGWSPEPGYVARVFARGPIHRHAATGPTDPVARFAAWRPWQRRVFLHHLGRAGGSAAWLRLGYAAQALDLEPPGPHTWRRCPGADPAPPGGAAPDPALGPLRCPPRAIAGVLGAAFDRVRARRVGLSGLRPGVARALAGWLRARGWPGGVELACLSPGTSRPLPEPVSSGGWRLAAVHPALHDRSPALVARHARAGIGFVLNLKGAGVRSLRHSFVARGGRCPRYLASLQDLRPRRPIDVLAPRPAGEWRSHALIGGALLLPSLMEAHHALGWHALLLEHDGAPAATAIPIGLALLDQIVLGNGQALPLWAYFTDPTLQTPDQLEVVARDAGLPPRLARRLPRRLVGALYLLRTVPVIYAHVTLGKLRAGHLFEELSDDAVIAERLGERGHAITHANLKTRIDAVIAELYAAHGHRPVPVEAPGGLETADGRFAYLRRIYEANQDTADAIGASAGARGGRSLGALHGWGGHGLGRRIKVRDRAGRPVRGRNGLAIRTGAPGGGSAEGRNMTVCGEWVDTTHLFNPRADPLSRLSSVLNQLSGDRLLRWASPGRIGLLQRLDLELASAAMAMLGACLTGDRAPVPGAMRRIQQLRRSRRRLEDTLGHGAPQPGVIEAIEAIEAQIGSLRDQLPPLGDSVALVAFRRAYAAHYGHARAHGGAPPAGGRVG